MSGMLQQCSSQAEGSDHTGGGKEKSEQNTTTTANNTTNSNTQRKEFNFWTDQEVCLLLDAYEEKWNQLDRANVKSKHWEEISHRLAAHNTGVWAAKTPTQCKNKIEDMKKKYRAEKAMKNGPGTTSKWAFFARMDDMLRNAAFKPVVTMPGGMDNGERSQGGNPSNPSNHQPNHGVTPVTIEMDSYSQLENLQFGRPCGRQPPAGDHDGNDEEDTSFSTPHNNGRNNIHGGATGFTGLLERANREDAGATAGFDGNRSGVKRRRGSGTTTSGTSLGEAVQVIKSFGESLVRIQEAQLQMQHEIARIHAETERRREEMENKRMEMMFNTQLQIAKMFSRKKKVVRGTTTTNDEEANGSRSNV